MELFHRRGRSVELTAAGRELYQIAQRIVVLEEEARDLLNAHGGFHTRHLKVGVVGPYHAIEMLSAFNERHPGVRLSVTVGNSRDMVERILDYSADVAVLAHVEDDPRIFAVPYSRHPVVIFVNTDHIWAKQGRTRIRIAELEGQRMVLREAGSTTRLAVEAPLRQASVTIDPVMEIGSRGAVWRSCAASASARSPTSSSFRTRRSALEVADAEIFTTAHVDCLTERRDSRLIREFFAGRSGPQGGARSEKERAQRTRRTKTR